MFADTSMNVAGNSVLPRDPTPSSSPGASPPSRARVEDGDWVVGGEVMIGALAVPWRRGAHPGSGRHRWTHRLIPMELRRRPLRPILVRAPAVGSAYLHVIIPMHVSR